jgi:hypothetical protein
MNKPLLAANLPSGRVRVYLDGEPDTAFWESLKTIADMMSKATLTGGTSSPIAKPKAKRNFKRGLGAADAAHHAPPPGGIAPPVVRPISESVEG